VGPDVGVAESINFVLMSLLMSTDYKKEKDVICGRKGFFRGIGEEGAVPSKGEECFFDVDVGFCTGLDEWDSKFLGKCFPLFLRNDAFFRPVAFIANQNLMDSLCSMLFDILEPCANIWSQFSIPKIAGAGGILLKDRSSVTSYTKRIPIAPR
jgi:hypothetical protein